MNQFQFMCSVIFVKVWFVGHAYPTSRSDPCSRTCPDSFSDSCSNSCPNACLLSGIDDSSSQQSEAWNLQVTDQITEERNYWAFHWLWQIHNVSLYQYSLCYIESILLLFLILLGKYVIVNAYSYTNTA